MIPYNSNKTGGCDNTSSNCVIWQGPDLPCIDICYGDTVSDVIAKLCEELIELSKAPGGSGTHELSRINQNGLENSSGQQARQANSETELQNLIIENVVAARQANQSEFGQGDVLATPVTLPEMLQYQDPNTATIVRALPLQQYATLLGTRISETTSEITVLQGQVANHEGRIISLENTDKRNKTNPTEKQIITTCVGTPGRLTNLSTALMSVEKAFCGLQEGTGPQSELAASIGYQASSLASAKKLNGVGDMNTYNGFITSPSSLAQSFTNAWIVINDMRAAVESLIADVVPTACKDITYGFWGNVMGTPGAAGNIVLNFTKSSIPSTFYDCDRAQGSKITITDAAGSSQVFHKQIHQLQNSNAGTQLTISTLDAASASYDVEVAFCFTNGQGVECANTQTQTITATDICPILTMGTPGLTSISWTVNAAYLPATYSAQIQLMNSEGSVITSQVSNAPGSNWTGSFTGLTAGAAYIIQISYGLTQGGTFDKVCPQQSFNTTGVTCTDYSILNATYKTVPADLQYSVAGSFTPIACDDLINPGVALGDIYIAGFTTADGEVGGILRNNTIWSESLAPCSAGTVTMNGVSIDYNNPVKSLVTNSITTAIRDATTNTLGDGWRYIDGITSTGGKNLFVYAEGNTTASTVPIIPQTYLSCVGDEVNISQQEWTTWVPRADSQYSFSANYNYQIAHGNTVASSALTYTIGAARYGVNSFTPNPVPAETQQFTYAPLISGTFTNSDSNTAALTIGSKTSDYITSLSRGFWPQSQTTDLVVIINTDDYTDTEGAQIKTAMIAVHSHIASTYSGYTGNLYILPIADCGFDKTKIPEGSVSAYLSNHKIIAMRGDGVTLTSSGAWSTVAQTYTAATTPVGWWTNSASTLATNMMLFTFTEQCNSIVCGETVNDLYDEATASAAPMSPTTRYKKDYDDVMNILVDNNRNTIANGGVGASAWAELETVQLNITYTTLENAIYKCDGHYVIPKQTGLHAGVDGKDKALIRQMILACNASIGVATPVLNSGEYDAYRSGSDYLNVETLTSWEANLVTNANPYNDTIATVNLNDLAPLTDLNITVVPYIDGYFEFASTAFTDEMKKLVCLSSVTGASAQPVAGSGNVMGATEQYGVSNAATATNTAAQACTNSASSKANVYNTTGVEFDGSVRAYTTAAGSIAQDYRDELFHDRWYARGPGGTGLPVAQYSRTYPHWKNATTCA